MEMTTPLIVVLVFAAVLITVIVAGLIAQRRDR